MKKYICDVCGYVYDPEVGDPDSGIEPGTAFEDIPEDWVCPVCGVGKDDFSLLSPLHPEMKLIEGRQEYQQREENSHIDMKLRAFEEVDEFHVFVWIGMIDNIRC